MKYEELTDKQLRYIYERYREEHSPFIACLFFGVAGWLCGFLMAILIF